MRATVWRKAFAPDILYEYPGWAGPEYKSVAKVIPLDFTDRAERLVGVSAERRMQELDEKFVWRQKEAI